ncbi:MAG: hypothetical protein IJM96_05060 [Clostridia bacterium]|nr:hypothetical protein [Clostridia bacterium]
MIGFAFAFFFVIMGIIIGLFFKKIVYGSPAKKQPVNTPSAYDIWWKNLKRTPLSSQESMQIAESVDKFYKNWKNDRYMNHSWLCLEIGASEVSCKQVYSYSGEIQIPPALTISYSHKISCQNDREMLASYILSAIKSDDPGCELFLDGDSLILPSNNM